MDVTRAAGPTTVGNGAETGGAHGAFPHVFPDGLVCGIDSPLIELRRTCVRVAASQATVLLTGETGTGKEVFARLIHAHSPRTKRQFVPVNCGAIPEALLESELFGYVKGAFTGASTPRRGRVSLAEGGTLFLDEIGELPLSLQVKLLRLLQQRTYEPVGSSESVTADFRLVAATNRDLLAEVRAGRFRQDLYYRLNVCPVHLPALRTRPGDVVALFLHFWRARGETRPIEPAVLRRLEAYDWPGNVRELENLVERVSVIAEGPVIGIADLPVPPGEPDPRAASAEAALAELVALSRTLPPPVAPVATPPPVVAAPLPPPITESVAAVTAAVAEIVASPEPPPALPGLTAPSGAAVNPLTPPPQVHPLPVNLPVLLRELEEAYIAKALAESGGNKKEAARLLGMGRTTLVEKLRRRNADTSAS